MIPTGPATADLPVDGVPRPVEVIGTESIRAAFDPVTLQQTANTARCPGVTRVVLNPDAHRGYGAPVGCVLASPTHIYPGPVGVDIKCSMSLLQLELPGDAIRSPQTRRQLIGAICQRVPTGPGKGQRSVKRARRVAPQLGRQAVAEGASKSVCEALGIPPAWAARCEDAFHRGHDGTLDALQHRLDVLLDGKRFPQFADKIAQLGSLGGGNHFAECEEVAIADDAQMRPIADHFGLRDGQVAFLTHCGSRGFGHDLAQNQFRTLQADFEKHRRAFPADDKQLVFAELGTPAADDYLDDMALGANFATVNHLLINALVLEAFQEVFPGVTGQLVYFISHNIARPEPLENTTTWVHRKGATRAFPAGHPGLRGTPFAETGHPILLPGNPTAGSAVMVAQPGAQRSCFSVNHGAGRTLGRRQAFRTLDQQVVNRGFETGDVLFNSRNYPLDEAPAAYKDFHEVLRSVELAGLARGVARLKARFVVKDAAKPDD
jgi:tRNA-splicing ligase RtcB